ncbi:MAG: 50S ribosomal protein L6 [Patescibacteria group bacterium]
MSRIGKAPIILPKDVTLTTMGNVAVIKGPKGELRLTLPPMVSLKITDSEITVVGQYTKKMGSALHGFIRAQLANHIKGVSEGWTRILEMSGVGYRASLAGANLVLTVGFSHPVTIAPPPGVTFAIREGKIVVSGPDKQVVGQVAANIRAIKKPDPYKGKGIKYQGERLRKKAGKSAKAIGAGTTGVK